jgi:transcription termination factor Rho
MSVLNRKELADSPLADLHQIASELGVEGYRAMRRDQLIAAILGASGGAVADIEEIEASETESEDESSEDEEDAPEDSADEGEEIVEEEPEVVEDEVSDDEVTTGVLDVLANGSGFVRVDPAGQSRADVYVSPAQIRRCELRAGDEVSGPARSPRRNERHPSLVRVEAVNGADAEPIEERPWFGELTAVFPTKKLPAPEALTDTPFGRGSRVAIATAPGAGAAELLRRLAAELARDEDLGVQVVLAGALPEEVTEWHRAGGLEVTGGSFDRSPEAQAQAAELAVERAKRRVERGGHAVVIIDSLDGLPAGARRRVFGAGRATEEGGTLTVIAAAGDDREPLRWATTRVVLGPDGKPAPESGTLRAELLSLRGAALSAQAFGWRTQRALAPAEWRSRASARPSRRIRTETRPSS